MDCPSQSGAAQESSTLVRPVGMVGAGKSTLGNSLVGYLRPGASNPWVCVQHFRSGTSTEGIKVDPSYVVWANPDVLGQGERLCFGDSEGIGSNSGDSVIVCDRILSQMKKEDATLLLVSRADRVDTPFVNVLRILKRCSSLSNDNCVLVFTKASDPPNGLDSSDIQVTPLINKLVEKTGLHDVFAEKDGDGMTKNVAVVDFDAHYGENMEAIRRMLLQRLPCKAHCTFSEMKRAAEGTQTGNEMALAIKERELTTAIEDRAWHENRIRDLKIAIGVTFLIPIYGQVSAGGMLIAIADSEAKVPRLNGTIEQLKREIVNKKEAVESAKRDVKEIENMLQRV